ncbi:Integrase, catalytic core [Gossypium australe]|uniref:Integrase, catalytic core n=1 Tax=Gossypium australe TaxID=47621 RepID=A0A5B6WUN9_9ROSI|nr:Integrase, catalytic core [Gossypium australe]
MPCVSTGKAEHEVPSELLKPIMIPEWKWEQVTMDFVLGLPLSPRKKYTIWVIVDRLTKSTHFIHVRTDYLLEKLAELFWGKLHEALGTKLNFNTAFHSQTNGQSDYQSSIKMALYEALYGQKCRTLLYLNELNDKKISSTDLIREIEYKVRIIQDYLKAASDPQKSYVDLKRKYIEFQVGDKIFLRLSSWKKVLHFG